MEPCNNSQDEIIIKSNITFPRHSLCFLINCHFFRSPQTPSFLCSLNIVLSLILNITGKGCFFPVNCPGIWDDKQVCS